MKNFNKILFLILLFSVSLKISGQEVLFEQSVGNDTVKRLYGPNLRHYGHFFGSLGFIAGAAESPGSSIRYGLSNHYEFGFRYKLKACKVYAIGADIYFNSYSFNLEQSNEKSFPNTFTHDKEKYTTYQLGADFFNRLNFGKRGNYIGAFLDIGIYGDWIMNSVHYTRDKLYNRTIQKIRLSRLKYTEPLVWGLLLRAGYNRWVVYARYRYSNLFDGAYAYSELPRITIGVQIGFH